MQMISTGAQYAVTSVLLLAREGRGAAVGASRLSEQVNAPTAYLSQTLAKLVPSGILRTERGKNGGVSLDRDAGDVTILDIVRIIDGDGLFTECIIGMPGCSESTSRKCPLHDEWGRIRSGIIDWLGQVTIRDLLDRADPDWLESHMKFSVKQLMKSQTSTTKPSSTI